MAKADCKQAGGVDADKSGNGDSARQGSDITTSSISPLGSETGHLMRPVAVLLYPSVHRSYRRHRLIRANGPSASPRPLRGLVSGDSPKFAGAGA